MILAGLGAVGVFVAVVSYVGQVRAQVGNMRPVLQLTRDVPANTEITGAMVRRVQTPAKWTPETMIRSLGFLRNKVSATSLPSGAYLQRGMVITAPALQEGQREIAIMINAETGVAGKVEPGSVVDIYATFEGTRQQAPCAVRILSSVRVIDVGQLRQQQGGGEGQVSTEAVVPITFALTAEQSLELTYAEAFANTVRLARIGGVGDAPAPPVDSVCAIPRTGQAGGSSGQAGASAAGRGG